MDDEASSEKKPTRSDVPQPHSVPSNPSHLHGPMPQSLDPRIADNYHETLEQVRLALDEAGLISSKLIIGIDFTKSNEWTGRSLHSLEGLQNPYEQAISIIGKTLAPLDDNLIPCFGFGDATTHDESVFSFYPDSRSCQGFEEVLKRYREIVSQRTLAGPTSFAPIIETAITIVEESGCQYHVLLIIANGQVTKSVDIKDGQLSLQEDNTINAIVKASYYPLSIILVGVGYGPWDMMREFDDNIISRVFDNIQFVDFTNTMSKDITLAKKETEFASNALMKLPSQYYTIVDLELLGIPSVHQYEMPSTSSNPTSGNQVCSLCLDQPMDTVFGCGHQACCKCGVGLLSCPICQKVIKIKIALRK